MAEWKRLAVVTMWISVRILVGSLNGYGFLSMLVGKSAGGWYFVTKKSIKGTMVVPDPVCI